jgi:hypothetical protein
VLIGSFPCALGAFEVQQSAGGLLNLKGQKGLKPPAVLSLLSIRMMSLSTLFCQLFLSTLFINFTLFEFIGMRHRSIEISRNLQVWIPIEASECMFRLIYQADCDNHSMTLRQY